MIRARVRYRPGDVRHIRTLVFEPGRWLIVLDWLSGARAHRYAQCFKLGRTCRVLCEGLPPEAEGTRAVHVSQFLDAGAPSLARGQTTPELRGWVSESYGALVPAPSLRFDLPPVQDARIGTILAVDEPARVVAHSLDDKLSLGWIDVESAGGVERVTLVR
ncbi:MAG: hypothetical protein H7X93_01580, partial [Sphingomonadaceae bacterium]|nr:hypothetical protein [Sphingomonadaceae bacterium]